MKKISNYILFILSILVIGCASDNTANNVNYNTREINIIKPPAWIDEKQYDNKIFYSIGETSGNSNIKVVFKEAENNAFEKIKQTIEKHINNIYYRNLAYISNKDRKEAYYNMIFTAASSVVNNENLKKYIIRENNWMNIDDLKMYVLVYIEPNIVKTFLINELKKISEQYKYDEAFIMFLEQLQQDIEKNFSLVIESVEKSITTNNQDVKSELSTASDSSIGAKIDEIELKEKQRNDIISKTIIYAKKNNIGK